MLRSRVLSVLLRGVLACFMLLAAVPLAHAAPAERPATTIPNRQAWSFLASDCTSQQGVALAPSTTGCGGTSTTFDAAKVYTPTVLQDVVTSAAPCGSLGLPIGSTCYRMWYTGAPGVDVPRVGYAVSADGTNWTRVVGPLTGGSVLDLGASGRFDMNGVAFVHVMKDGSTFKMWYTGYGSNYIDGIGYATSTDGVTWIKTYGSLPGGAVLRASGQNGTFDRDYIGAPRVFKDIVTSQLACGSLGLPVGSTCYRMWYEGVNQVESGFYFFRIGHAVSPDGITWTRVAGSAGQNSVIGTGPSGTFDEVSIGIVSVVKEGPLFRLWYEGKRYGDNNYMNMGYVVSTDGVTWVRPEPNTPVYNSTDDPVAPSPDYIWAPSVVKLGASYRMWYTISNERSIAAASMTPGTNIAATVNRSGSTYTVNFTTAQAIPAGGFVLLTLNPVVDLNGLSFGSSSGFPADATFSVDANAITDGYATHVARSAIVVHLPSGAPVGSKSLSFSLASLPAVDTPLLLQSFDSREVLEYATATFPRDPNAATPTATSTPTPTSTSALPTSTPIPSATNTPTATATNTSVPATSTPTATTVTSAGGNAVQFSGASQYAAGPALVGTEGTQTIELWMRAADADNAPDGIALATGTGVGNSGGWAVSLINGQVNWFQQAANGDYYAASAGPIVSNTWYHVAITFDASTNTAQVYLNGVPGTATVVQPLVRGPQFRVGGIDGYTFFNGQIDEVRISNVLRYNAAFAPPSAPFASDTTTIALYRFNEGTGTTTADASANGYNLTFSPSAPTWVSSTAPLTGAQPTATATSTPVPPTNTPTATATATATATPTPLPNLVANGGFETDSNNDTRPDSWTSSSLFTRSTVAIRSGSYAGRHRSTSNSSYSITQTVSGISAGQNYTVNAWTNIPATSDSFTYRVRVRWVSSLGLTIRTNTVRTYTAATDGWNQASATLTAPTGATQAQIIMSVSSLNATIYVDDVSLQRIQ